MEIYYFGLLVLAYHVFIFPLQLLKLTSYIDYMETWVIIPPCSSDFMQIEIP